MADICSAHGLAKGYDGLSVFEGLDLRVEKGEILGITGPSGSGKSTLLNLVGLLERPDAGRLELFGAPAPRTGSRVARGLLRQRIGYLFQNYALADNATVAWNLAVAQRYAQGSRRHKAHDQTAALERVGLTGYASRPVHTLSGGEQQRTAVARLLVNPRELLLADEPTGSLDPVNRDAILEMLTELRSSGTTVVVVTHDPAVTTICDRVIDLGSAQRQPVDGISAPHAGT